MKDKKCKNCSELFKQFRPLQNVCSLECSIELSNTKQKEIERMLWNKEKKVRKDALKTREDYYQDALVMFNKFIRTRDRDQPCISCNASSGTYRITSGHYYPQGTYRNIALDERNAHGQCWYNCNKNKHGNLLEYRPRLIKKIGLEKVEQLDIDAQQKVSKYNILELKELREFYRLKIKNM